MSIMSFVVSMSVVCWKFVVSDIFVDKILLIKMDNLLSALIYNIVRHTISYIYSNIHNLIPTMLMNSCQMAKMAVGTTSKYAILTKVVPKRQLLYTTSYSSLYE